MQILEQAIRTTSPSTAISVVLLTWNEQPNIEACLASLARQTRLDFEIVVVDAASTDDTACIVAGLSTEFPVPLRLYVASTRIRVGPARNLGVRLAKSPLIAFLSADTEAEPTWIEQCLN